MEQALLRRFDHLRHPHNREVLVPVQVGEIETAWREYILQRSRAGR